VREDDRKREPELRYKFGPEEETYNIVAATAYFVV